MRIPISIQRLPFLVTAIGLLITAWPCYGQTEDHNPLRKQVEDNTRQIENNTWQTPTSINQASPSQRPLSSSTSPSYQSEFRSSIPARDSLTEPNQSIEQQRIRLATYQAQSSPPNSSEASASTPRSRNLIASAEKMPWQDPSAILDLVMKISLNLVFVLSFAFGAILLARKWMPNTGGHSGNDRLSSDSLTILQTLRIDPKISIRLVQWRSNRFLIACDQNGIQSVNTLNDSFDQTLTELESEDQLVSKLLASLDGNKG